MYIPVVPSVPHTRVINQTIVYSDTVLNLKETGNNLKVTSIANVKEYDLEKCLKIIFESNPNVVFNTVQYSKNDKKVYFYINQEITTKAYDESKYIKYKPISSRTEILEEIKSVLMAPKNKDNNCISLYDVSMLLKRLNNEYNCIEKKYKNRIEFILDNELSDSSFIFRRFDYEEMTLHTSFKRYRHSDWGNIDFAKQNGDLYVIKSDSCWSNEVFSVLSSCLSEMYDELLKYSDYKNLKYAKFDKKSINSNFIVKITPFGISISINEFRNLFRNDFELLSPSDENNYVLKCNSSVINDAIKGNEGEIFKRIFVRISDCPEWSQTMLYEIRQNQLAEEQKFEDIIEYRKIKKEKRLQLIRKVFPFIKK